MNEQTLLDLLTAIEAQREEFLKQANEQLIFLNGKIAAIKELIETDKSQEPN